MKVALVVLLAVCLLLSLVPTLSSRAVHVAQCRFLSIPAFRSVVHIEPSKPRCSLFLVRFCQCVALAAAELEVSVLSHLDTVEQQITAYAAAVCCCLPGSVDASFPADSVWPRWRPRPPLSSRPCLYSSRCSWSSLRPSCEQRATHPQLKTMARACTFRSSGPTLTSATSCRGSWRRIRPRAK